MPKRPDYGIDAPGVLIALLAIGVIGQLLGLFAPPLKMGPVAGGILLLQGLLTFIYVKWGKFRHRDRMLAQIPWTGSEWVLDVGTGRGLLLIGAAKSLTNGRAIGIDIWSTKDLSGNAPERTQANITLEGVSDKCELRSEDASQMSFPDRSFDVVVSNLCIHNIPREAGRDQTYAAVFADEGFAVEWRGPFWRDVFPPLKMFVARKPL